MQQEALLETLRQQASLQTVASLRREAKPELFDCVCSHASFSKLLACPSSRRPIELLPEVNDGHLVHFQQRFPSGRVLPRRWIIVGQLRQ